LIVPERWVLFHPDQYALNGFPFEPLTHRTRCRWICFRNVADGEPAWVPEEFAYLLPRAGSPHRFCPAISTGLAAGTAEQPVVLRALQEVIERDALLGAWWGRYPLREHPKEKTWSAEETHRLQRPNLRWRFFSIDSPFSNHVTMVTLEGEDREGFCFSIGSACRESRRASWSKATLEAVQGRHYVRRLREQYGNQFLQTPLRSFAEHAVYYTFHPEELQRTILHSAAAVSEPVVPSEETLQLLCERVGRTSSVLMRSLTPPSLVGEGLDWCVVKVVVPGLQPLHGDDHFAHLGGALWVPRKPEGCTHEPPHPFP
jgi:thiazole/oxazole-forming peptide maturase SagD family component